MGVPEAGRLSRAAQHRRRGLRRRQRGQRRALDDRADRGAGHGAVADADAAAARRPDPETRLTHAMMRGPRGPLVVAVSSRCWRSAAHHRRRPGHVRQRAAGAASRTADYDIRVRLDADAKRLDGRLHLTWRNPSSERRGALVPPVPERVRESESTFCSESGGQLRGGAMPEDGWGCIDVKSMRIADGADLLPALTLRGAGRRQAPGPHRGARPAARARAAGRQRSRSRSRSRAKLPKVFARTGYVARLLPRRAVVSRRSASTSRPGCAGEQPAAGTATQFHAESEFYADFGNYRRRDDACRSRFVVGATGKRVARDEDRTTRPPIATCRRTSTTSPGRRRPASSRSTAPFDAAAKDVSAGVRRGRGAGRPAARSCGSATSTCTC